MFRSRASSKKLIRCTGVCHCLASWAAAVDEGQVSEYVEPEHEPAHEPAHEHSREPERESGREPSHEPGRQPAPEPDHERKFPVAEQ